MQLVIFSVRKYYTFDQKGEKTESKMYCLLLLNALLDKKHEKEEVVNSIVGG